MTMLQMTHKLLVQDQAVYLTSLFKYLVVKVADFALFTLYNISASKCQGGTNTCCLDDECDASHRLVYMTQVSHKSKLRIYNIDAHQDEFIYLCNFHLFYL